MKSNLKDLIENSLKNYETKRIKFFEKEYNLYLVPELFDEHLNLFEGFLYAEVDGRSEFSYFKTGYRAPVSGYVPRIGLIFYDEYLLIKDYRRNKYIMKKLDKISETFIKKLKKALVEPKEENFNKLFDRSDVIEEFYILFKKSREFLLKNITGIPEEEKRVEFVDNFMMQMLTLWYLQERGFFNNDKSYFITKFKELKQEKLFGKEFKTYYDFLIYLFEKISNNINKQYYEDEKIGKVVVVGPAVFINGEPIKAISIPDKCFYKEDLTEILIKTHPKKVGNDIPLLNLFESRDWTEGNIDEYVLGAIYEKLITYMERKKLGAYYTPEEITTYISKNTIEPYLVDIINEKYNKNLKSIDEVIETNNKEILLDLFEKLKEIKILDPAVGSAHFLASAIDVLLDIYEKVIEKAKELGIANGLTIIATNEKGEINKIDLLSIEDKENFRLLVKFFIILSKNIYGVDIYPSALKIARARLFLTMAKHFKVDNGKDIFVRFPNVHFNLRAGNSLVGYVKPEKEEQKKQLSLDIFDQEKQTRYISEKIKIVSELRTYIDKVASALNINENISKEIETLNEILSKENIDWNDFERVLITKEKLIRILIASLNSEYAVPLNALLREITDLFNQKLDEKFAKEYNINLEDLKKIKTFHWFFEFPEVFLDREGFDIVLGNPPYKRQEEINKIYIGINYKKILSKIYTPFDKTFDFSMFFIMRSLQLLKSKGYHSFIITNKWMRAKYGKKIRELLKKNVHIKKIIDFNGIKVFIGPSVDAMIYVIKLEKPKEESEIYYNHPSNLNSIEAKGKRVKQENLSDLWNFVNEEEKEIKEWIEKFGTPLKELDVKINYGIKTGFNNAFIIDDETRKKLIKEDPKSEKLIKPLLRGRDIGRYYVNWDRKWIIIIPAGFTKNFIVKNMPLEKAEKIFKEKYPSIYCHFEQFKNVRADKGKGLVNRDDQGDYWWELRPCNYYQEFEKSKIMWQEIVREPSFYLDSSKIYGEATSFIMTSEKISLKLLLLLLNSKISWIAIKLYGTNLGEDTARYKKAYIKKIPVRLPKLIKPYEIVAEILLFLNSKIEREQKLKEIIEYFDRQIADTLVYELYFKEKFHKDSLYPELKEYLLEVFSKHLKPINYNRWAELYWKKQLEGNLIEDEERELEKLENENLKIIEDIYKSLRTDKELQYWIEKIKSYKWIKIIEGNQ